MKCKSCEYPLWNLRERVCPECGMGFQPGDYDFNANAVGFACPHCALVYYGTSVRGHLVPEQFDCLECGRPIHMNEMILTPAEGVEEQRLAEGLAPDRAENPWHVSRGWKLWRAFFSTLGKSISAAPRLMETTPTDSSPARAGAWAALLGALSLTIGGAWCGCSPFMWLAASGTSGASALVAFAIVLVLVPAWILIYGFAAHSLLRASGGGEHGLSRTYQAVAYSAGPLVLCAVPMLGGLLMLPAFVWWGVNASGALRSGQRVGAWRAVFAALVPMFALIAGLVTLVVVLWPKGGAMFPGGAMTATVTSQARTQVQTVTSAMLADGSAWPTHAAGLLGAGVTPGDFVNDEIWVPNSGWTPMLGPHTPSEVLSMTEDDRAALSLKLAAALPPATVAYRVGDVVFCHGQLDRTTVPGDLWIVVGALDPSPARGPVMVTPYEYVVGQADGSVRAYTSTVFRAALQSQNTRRRVQGLPELPDVTRLMSDTPYAPSSPGDPP